MKTQTPPHWLTRTRRATLVALGGAALLTTLTTAQADAAGATLATGRSKIIHAQATSAPGATSSAEASAEAAAEATAPGASATTEQATKDYQGFLGVHIQDLTPELAGYLGYGGDHGIVVSQVDPDGPAAKAGVQRGDVLIEFDGQTLYTSQQLVALVADQAPDTRVDVNVVRDGAPRTLAITLGKTQRIASGLTRMGQPPAWGARRGMGANHFGPGGGPGLRAKLYQPQTQDPSAQADPGGAPNAALEPSPIWERISKDPDYFQQEFAEPFEQMRQLHEEMDRLMNQRFGALGSMQGWGDPLNGVGGTGTTMRLDLDPVSDFDITEDDANYIVKLHVPGAAADNLDVRVDDGRTLSVAGQYRAEEKTERDGRVVSQSVRSGSFKRAVILPGKVDSAKMKVDVDDEGLCTITLPKA